jgi:probable HAF family extracellular repeat protein
MSVPFAGRLLGGMQDLGTLGGLVSRAYGVSADGSVVVGGETPHTGRAFRWTASGGMEDLNTTYASLLTDGSGFEEARAISPDGRYIVGMGLGTPGAGKPSCWIRASRCAGMWTATAAWTTPTCWRCCSRLAGSNLNEDVNCDGVVDDADLLQVLFHFGSGC